MSGRSVMLSLLGGALLLSAGAARAFQGPATFDHGAHAKLFVACTTCHVGAETPGAPLLPGAVSCAACHDGQVQKRIEWTPRSGPRVSNLRFDHLRHEGLRRAKSPGDSSGTCSDCHADRGARWMQVRAPTAPQCLGCHTPGRTDHLAAPDSACASCHLPLARATALPTARVAKFPTPATHRAAGFMEPGGHGAAAKRVTGSLGVAASCATCHARDFCAACHVDAPEVPVIQALEADARALALKHELTAPASHAAKSFESGHGRLAEKSIASCRTCHTQESCLTCHLVQVPKAAQGLYHAASGRGEGARTTRRAPATHTATWREGHGPLAAVSMRSCTTCHARDECLSCHIPGAAKRGSYHPASYLTRHPADAYARSSACADCHNTGEFCQSCHNQAGLSSRRTLLGPGGYHDGNRQFFLGHGQAARQALESCVSCHVERECLTCHSVVRGRGFNPHGPGFDPERLLRKNPQLCIACHGTSIPRRR